MTGYIGYQCVVYNNTLLPFPNQYVEIKLTGLTSYLDSTNHKAYVILRANTSNLDRIEIQINYDNLSFYKYENTVYKYIGSYSLSPNLLSTDLLKFQADSGSVIIYKNGTEIVRFVSQDKRIGGRFGFGLYDQVSSVVQATYWAGGYMYSNTSLPCFSNS